MSYDEIAETMGMSLEAVKSVLFRAKENLKQALSKYAGGTS
jgi:DNA-directed RNA polymerase specialized sigma24 family protein